MLKINWILYYYSIITEYYIITLFIVRRSFLSKRSRFDIREPTVCSFVKVILNFSILKIFFVIHSSGSWKKWREFCDMLCKILKGSMQRSLSACRGKYTTRGFMSVKGREKRAFSSCWQRTAFIEAPRTKSWITLTRLMYSLNFNTQCPSVREREPCSRS